MAGLAGALGAPGSIDALAVALAARGADGALLRLECPGGVRLEVAMRAVMPAIPRVVGDPDGERPRDIAAFAVDGIASITALDAGYAERGPLGLIGGEEPYAVILADVETEALVLARNLDGPGLYYARRGGGWLVASEPAALVAVGVSGEPDVEVVRRFIATGSCDETDRTFFASIRRVRPGEVVVLTQGGGVKSHLTPVPARPESAAEALAGAVAGGRVALLLGPGLPGAALLGTALARNDRPRPLPVHTTTFPDIAGAAHTPAALVPIPFGAIRHTSHTFTVGSLDLEGFLADLGEPVPDLQEYLLWDVARNLGGGVDTLVDSLPGTAASVARLSDRISARYGVIVRCPLREVAATKTDWKSLVDSLLPAAVVRHALHDSAGSVTSAEVLLADRESVAAALAIQRPWSDRVANVEALRKLNAGEPVDADALFRAYLVERWLRVSTGRPGMVEERDADDITVRDTWWARIPIRTEVLSVGAPLAPKAAWYVANRLADLVTDEACRDALAGPWFAVLSGKAVAVSQRRVRPLWEIVPGPAARLLAQLARRRLPRLGEAWTMQVAMEEAGVFRVAVGVLATALSASWGVRLLPDAAMTVFPPRPDAVAPADGAVVRGPFKPDDAAEALLEALRFCLPPALLSSLAGCAVVSADATGSSVLGFASGPHVSAVDRPEALVAEICADNPAGQAGECTPLVVAFEAPLLDGAWADYPEVATSGGV
jgi:hypothetical protein